MSSVAHGLSLSLSICLSFSHTHTQSGRVHRLQGMAVSRPSCLQGKTRALSLSLSVSLSVSLTHTHFGCVRRLATTTRSRPSCRSLSLYIYVSRALPLVLSVCLSLSLSRSYTHFHPLKPSSCPQTSDYEGITSVMSSPLSIYICISRALSLFLSLSLASLFHTNVFARLNPTRVRRLATSD